MLLFPSCGLERYDRFILLELLHTEEVEDRLLELVKDGVEGGVPEKVWISGDGDPRSSIIKDCSS